MINQAFKKQPNATTQKYKNQTQPKWNCWGFNKRNSNKISIQLFSQKINYIKSTIVLLIFVQKINSTKYTNSKKYTTKKIHHFSSNQSNFLYPFIIFPLTEQLQNQVSWVSTTKRRNKWLNFKILVTCVTFKERPTRFPTMYLMNLY